MFLSRLPSEVKRSELFQLGLCEPGRQRNMKHGSNNKNKSVLDNEEAQIDQWLEGADLSKLSKKKFKRVQFSNLQPTNWDKLYDDFQKTKPINIRLPIRLIAKLKQVSLQKGLAYQSLIRLWLTEKLVG